MVSARLILKPGVDLDPGYCCTGPYRARTKPLMWGVALSLAHSDSILTIATYFVRSGKYEFIFESADLVVDETQTPVK
jgi:hypothetical protein